MEMNLLKNIEPFRCSNAVAAGTSTINGSGVDCSDCDGVLFLVPLGTLTSTAVTSLKAQQSSDDGSADDYTDLAGTSVTIADTQSNKVAVLDVPRPVKKWVRPVVLRGTANAVVDGIIAIKYNLRKMPKTPGSTIVSTSKTVVSPAEGTP